MKKQVFLKRTKLHAEQRRHLKTSHHRDSFLLIFWCCASGQARPTHLLAGPVSFLRCCWVQCSLLTGGGYNIFNNPQLTSKQLLVPGGLVYVVQSIQWIVKDVPLILGSVNVKGIHCNFWKRPKLFVVFFGPPPLSYQLIQAGRKTHERG